MASAEQTVELFAELVEKYMQVLDTYAMKYSHRNGETEPPTTAGYYGFIRKGLRHGWIVTVVSYNEAGEMRAYSGTKHDEEYRELEPGQWWGPITGPWEAS